MKILIAAASKHGSTREIAEAIAEELRTHELSVDVYDASEIGTVANYDAVILGSAIYAGSWMPEAKQFSERNRVAMENIPVWVFSSGPLGDVNPQPANDTAVLAESLGEVKPRDHQVFVGKMELSSLGFAEKLITKALRAPVGDFRDWDVIREWARGIAAELRGERSFSEL